MLHLRVEAQEFRDEIERILEIELRIGLSYSYTRMTTRWLCFLAIRSMIPLKRSSGVTSEGYLPYTSSNLHR